MSGQMMSTPERAVAGCIVTLVNLDTGELRVEHSAGYHYQSSGRAWQDPELKGRPSRLRGAPAIVLSRATRRPRKRNRETHTVNVQDALRLLLEKVDGWPGDWRVRTISTPQTILADMRGRKQGGPNGEQAVIPPEHQLLAKVGRLDMWERTERDRVPEIG